MKRLFSLAAFLFALCGLALSAEPKKPAGEGTANAPYQLACYEELLWLAGNAASVSNAYMDLANDIDASASFDEEEFFPGITAYGIHFNGRGHELKNLKFELVKTEYYGSYDFSGSLFKRINNSELTDFALSHMSLAQDIRRSSLHKIVYSVTNDYYFLARAINRTNFESIEINAEVSNKDLVRSGVLAFEIYESTITGLKLNAKIETGDDAFYGGGLAYLCRNCQISNVTANIDFDIKYNGTTYHGGLFGEAYDSVFSLAKINIKIKKGIEHTYVGGLVGKGERNVFYGLFETEVLGDDEGYIGGLVGRGEYNQFFNLDIKANINGDEAGSLMGEGRYNSISNLTVTVCCSGGSAGGLVGKSIDDVFNRINASVNLNSRTSGGIAGSSYGIKAERCYVEGIITGDGYSGGVSGECGESFVVNTEVIADISGLISGGLFAEAYDTVISNSCFFGNISAEWTCCGLAAGTKNLKVTSSYFDMSQSYWNGYGTPLGARKIKEKVSFVGWDFYNVWDIYDGYSIPFLRSSNYNFVKPMDKTLLLKGRAKNKLSFSGKISPNDLSAIKSSKAVCIFSNEPENKITKDISFNAGNYQDLSSYDPVTKTSVNYKKKTRNLTFSSGDLNICLARSENADYVPCELETSAAKITSQFRLLDDMSKYLTYGGNLTLIDLEKGGGVLNETKATLTEKGKKLVYQASTDEMRLKIDLSTATGKVNVKYCDYKNIQPVLKY